MGQFKVGDRVDVLAVMDRLTGHARTLAMTGDPAIRESIRMAAEARDAVRELIEAASKLRADVYLWRLTGNMPNLSMLAHDEERLDAALAQVSP